MDTASVFSTTILVVLRSDELENELDEDKLDTATDVPQNPQDRTDDVVYILSSSCAGRCEISCPMWNGEVSDH